MRIIGLALLWMGSALAGPMEDFVAAAREKHGTKGEKAAKFLIEHMPDKDKESLTAGFLTSHLDSVFAARSEFPWAADVPWAIFLNDVLPYAVFDETREPWHAKLREIARPLVRNAKSASEAAQTLNQGLFNQIKVHYHTGRKKPNQSLGESMASGRATCTGLSIILVSACRSVGIPARAVGTPLWANGRGNHTWVEIWDKGWHFTGADEYDAGGLNRGWFTGDAAQAMPDPPQHGIYATSWKRAGLCFPMVWAPGNGDVAAINVTGRYAKPQAAADGMAHLGVRLFDRKGGRRVVAKVGLLEKSGTRHETQLTRAGTADLNDMPRLTLKAGSSGKLLFTLGGETRAMDFGPLPPGNPTIDALWEELPKWDKP